MTSQPDPKDGPREKLLAYLDERIQESAEDQEDENDASWGYETGVLLTRAQASLAAAALRVVPPEGADNAVHLTVAWNAFSRAWPYETTPTLRDALFVAVEAALESAALRASGAGTRQEEPRREG